MVAQQGADIDPEPFVPAHISLPELTLKAIVLGVLLSVVLSSANVYLALFAGMSVSASIPAAVISMGILRLFRNRNILENNIVQTTTSAGEALSAGIIFTVPALVILGVWDGFIGNALEIVLIAAFAGMIGVVFTVPLRRAFIVEARLRYPEGIACAEVLEVGETGGRGVLIIALGGLLGGLVKLFSGGLAMWRETAAFAGRAGNALFPFGSNLSPALVGVGYIIGPNIAGVVFLGGAIAWLVAMPIYTLSVGLPAGLVTSEGLYAHATTLWSTQIRYMGVGAMAVGGLYALIRLAHPLYDGISSGIKAYGARRRGERPPSIRTEADLPMLWLGVLVLVSLVPLGWVYYQFTESVPRTLMLALIMVLLGFLFSSVAGYMAGLVGSSSNPISGVTIAAALVTGGLLWLSGISDTLGPLGTVAVAATIAAAGALAGDNMQDLKTGYMVGATPRLQQSAQMIGVVAAALSLPFILEIIHQGYGICTGQATDPSGCLPAPQATIIASVAGTFFGDPIPWTMAAIGAGIALLVILADVALEVRRSTFRMPVLAVAVGIYLPIALTTAIFLGGLVALAVTGYHRRHARRFADRSMRRKRGLRNGLLLASGLIAGEAIFGILLGIPRLPAFAPEGGNPLALFEPTLFPITGVLIMGFVLFLLYYVGIRPFLPVDDVGPGEDDRR